MTYKTPKYIPCPHCRHSIAFNSLLPLADEDADSLHCSRCYKRIPFQYAAAQITNQPQQILRRNLDSPQQ